MSLNKKYPYYLDLKEKAWKTDIGKRSFKEPTYNLTTRLRFHFKTLFLWECLIMSRFVTRLGKELIEKEL